MSDLREAIRDAIYDLDLRVDSGQAYIFDSDECEERILDAVIAALPEPINPDKPMPKFDVGRISYYADIHSLLQQAKSTKEQSNPLEGEER